MKTITNTIDQTQTQDRWRWLTAGVIALVITAAASNAAEPGKTEMMPERIQQLIRQLGDESWSVRERATEELKKIGPPARAALAQGLDSPDAETVARIRKLLVDLPWAFPKEDTPEIQRLLESYGKLEKQDRLDVVRKVSLLSPAQAQPAMLRIVQYDADEDVAFAAAKVFESRSGDQTAAQVLAANLTVQRPAVVELVAWAQTRTKQPQAAATMETAIALEKKRLSQLSDETRDDKRHLADMTLSLATLYRDSGGPAEAEKTVKNLADLVSKKSDFAWDILGRALNAGFARQLGSVLDKLKTDAPQDPRAIYVLAKEAEAVGDTTRAKTESERAFAAGEGDREQRLQTGDFLLRHGWTDWAEQELLSLTKDSQDVFTANALLRLWNISRDKQQYQLAADQLEKALQIIKSLHGTITGATMEELENRALMLRFRQFQKAGDKTRMLEILDTVLKKDPCQSDAVIESYNLLMSDKRADEAVQRVETARTAALDLIQRDPQQHNLLNELAWILARTNQHLEEAQQLSEKSLTMDPDNHAYLDTLAEILFRRGQPEKAAELEKRVLTLSPNNPTYEAQLKRFQTEKPPAPK